MVKIFRFSKQSIEKLKTVDEKLQILFLMAITNSPHDFKITEGFRSFKRQQELVKAGKSQTLRSYHLRGRAVDIAIIIDGKLSWEYKYYKDVANHIKAIAADLGYTITWGGDWKTFIDAPHFQLED